MRIDQPHLLDEETVTELADHPIWYVHPEHTFDAEEAYEMFDLYYHAAVTAKHLFAELRLAREVVEAAKAYVDYHLLGPPYEYDPEIGPVVWTNLVAAIARYNEGVK